jgi:hypothetical protein
MLEDLQRIRHTIWTVYGVETSADMFNYVDGQWTIYHMLPMEWAEYMYGPDSEYGRAIAE